MPLLSICSFTINIQHYVVMSDYWILSTMPRLEERICELATSLHSKLSGEVKKLAKDGELLIYAEREESIALS